MILVDLDANIDERVGPTGMATRRRRHGRDAVVMVEARRRRLARRRGGQVVTGWARHGVNGAERERGIGQTVRRHDDKVRHTHTYKGPGLAWRISEWGFTPAAGLSV